MTLSRFVQVLLVIAALAAAVPASAQQHAPAPPPASQGSPVPKGAQPVDPAHPPVEHVEEEGHEEGGLLPMVARFFNFAILVGILVYFLKSPMVRYLVSRSTQIRQDLVSAADMRATATAQLGEIRSRMAALPAELDALRRQGAEDVRMEQGRIAEAAARERGRLLDQTRREIDMRLRLARRELTEHAAQLAVQVAEQRIRRVITADDQIRLVDRYATQLKEAR